MAQNIHPYSAHFSSEKVCKGYVTKFGSNVDRIRHDSEITLLGNEIRGDLFDCSIAVGRFIGQLPRVTRYSGMDYSQPFVDYIRANFPGIQVDRGDLLVGIDQPDASHDAVMCLRTLFALGRTEEILREMVRITRPGGLVVFDYGVTPKATKVDGSELMTSGEDIDAILSRLPVKSRREFPLDGLICTLKRYPLIATAIHLSAKLPPLYRFWLGVERLSLKRSGGERRLFLLEV